MTKSTKHKLEYQKKYNARPAIVNRREENNAARREMERKGLAHKGDGKDVGHKVPLDRTTRNANRPGNLEMQSRKENRGWRRGKHGYNP